MSSDRTWGPHAGQSQTDRDDIVTGALKQSADDAAWYATARCLVRAAQFGLVLVAALFVGGFLQFASRIADLAPIGQEHADGIVALTGGRDRIRGAIELLRGGHGERLLISGVHPTTRTEDLQRAGETAADLFSCCIDLGFKAATTIGNAREAAEWAGHHGFRSLIVVTSAYHMPRSLAVFAHEMPGVRLVPYPIRHAELNLEDWYAHSDAVKLLLLEYVKYTVARLRLVADAS
jgi:uncharacterized SAM-binding protein YcdF (DUF218 family)